MYDYQPLVSLTQGSPFWEHWLWKTNVCKLEKLFRSTGTNCISVLLGKRPSCVWNTPLWARFTYRKLGLTGGRLVRSQSTWNEHLIYKGYSSLRNQLTGMPTNPFLWKRQSLNSHFSVVSRGSSQFDTYNPCFLGRICHIFTWNCKRLSTSGPMFIMDYLHWAKYSINRIPWSPKMKWWIWQVGTCPHTGRYSMCCMYESAVVCSWPHCVYIHWWAHWFEIQLLRQFSQM